MLLILGASLIWPEKFRSVLSRGADPERTITLAVRESETQNSPLGTEEIQGSPGGPSSTPEQVETTSSEAEINPTITPSGGGIGMIAYVSESTGLPQIWLLDVDKGLTYQLTHLDEGACQPDWSPDGKRIVFTSPCPGKRSRYRGSSLFILDINENELTQLTDSLEGDFDPAWSPGGDWIAYTSSINGQLQLYKINTNDSSVVKLSDGAYNDSDPAWSAEGGRLAFIRTRGVDQVWLMDFDGSNPVQFTLSGEIDNSNPCWFSKEDLIIFSQTLGLGSPSKQIFGMRLGDIGKDEEYPITPAAQMDYIPLMDNVDVSPDGSLLAFDYWYFDVLSDIYIMRFPGLDLQQMTDDPAPDYDPVWRSLP
jgi:Tol biopolymer transport system component